MDIKMTTTEIVENVRSSFEMEGMTMTGEDEKRGLAILQGKIDIEQVIEEIKKLEKHFDKSAITEFKNKFMSACDGNSAKRIFDTIVK